MDKDVESAFTRLVLPLSTWPKIPMLIFKTPLESAMLKSLLEDEEDGEVVEVEVRCATSDDIFYFALCKSFFLLYRFWVIFSSSLTNIRRSLIYYF